MAEKVLYLPPSFDVESYLRKKNGALEDVVMDRVENNFGNFAGVSSNLSPSSGGQFQFNPFGLPQSAQFPGAEMLSNTNTIFNNLRFYFISNFRQVLSEMYVELGLVQTIVDVPVDDALRGGVEIKTKQLSPEQVDELQISLDRDDDLTTIGQTAKWNRLFGGAGTLILTDQDPREPLDLKAITKDSPLEFRAVDLWELFWDKQNTEGYDPQIQSQEFEFYNYYGEVIHKSRVMRSKGMTAPSFVRPRLRGWGFSVVEVLVRSINQYLKATDLAFEVLDEFKLDIYKIKNLVNTLLSPQGANKVKQRVAVANQIKNYQNAIVIDSEDDYEQKQLSFSGLAETMGQIRMQVASDLRMPMTKLFGISAAGFNSGEDDIEVYNSMVESQVRNKIKYQILRVLEVKCQKMFGFIPDDLAITFKPLRVMGADQEETVKTQKFNRVMQAVQANQITPDVFVDAVNKDQLLGVTLAAPEQLNPPQDDTVKETSFLDPFDSKSTADPGTSRPDVRYPLAFEYEGLPSGQKKITVKRQQPPPEAGDSKLARDAVRQPGKQHPFGPATTADKAATKPDQPTSEDPERKEPEWLDEPIEEDQDAQHKLKLDKPKKVGEDQAPEAENPTDKKPKSGLAQKKTTPPEPAPHPEKRPPGVAKRDGSQRRVNNKAGRGDFPGDSMGGSGSAPKGRQFPDETPTLVQQRGHQFVDGEASPRFDYFEQDDSDLVRKKKPFFGSVDDRIVDNRKKGDPQHPDKPVQIKKIAVVAVISGKNQWLLTGKRRDTGLWVSPGGHVNPGEAFEQAAARELFEEAGIKVRPEDLKLLTTRRFVYPNGNETQVAAYQVNLEEKVPGKTINDPDEEVSTWRWVPLSPKTHELKSWNRHAQDDVVTETLLK